MAGRSSSSFTIVSTGASSRLGNGDREFAVLLAELNFAAVEQRGGLDFRRQRGQFDAAVRRNS